MNRALRNPSKQTGLAAVETALVGAVVMMVLFGVFEVARLFFVANALEEATRRGARVAEAPGRARPAVRRGRPPFVRLVRPCWARRARRGARRGDLRRFP